MPYQVPTDLDDQIRAFIATGRYVSEDDVLRDALRALERQRSEVAAIQEGIDDMESGRVTPLRQFDREFRERNNIVQDA